MLKHLVALLLIGVTITASAQEWKEAEYGNYTVSYPENWSIELGPAGGDSSMLFTFFAPAKSANVRGEKVTIEMHEAPTIFNLREEADSTIAFLRSATTDFKLHEGPTFGHGKFVNAFAITYSDMREGTNWKTYTVWMSEKGILHSIMFVAPEKEFDKLADTVKQIALSFKEKK